MAWYNDSWPKRLPLTVDHTKVTGAVSDFQVRARLVDNPNLGPVGRFDGRDVLVTASNGTTKLPHALVRYDATTGIDACWTWFNDPRAVYDAASNCTFVGWITSDGKIQVGAFSHTANTWTIGTLATGFEPDDHNNPAIVIRSDGRLLVGYSEHNGAAYCRVSTNPRAVSAWNAAVTVSVGTQAYCNLVQLATGRVYWFFRNGSANPRPQAFRYSDDGGATWSALQSMFNVASNRPYFKVTTNQNDATRIDFACTDGQPNEATTNSIYHFYLRDVSGTRSYYKSDGTLIGSDAALPIGPSDVTKVYDGTTNRAWVWDVATDASGMPAIVYIAFPSTDDLRYRYAKWSGSAWVDNEIVSAGDTYDVTSEPYYGPGICLDRADPRIVYLIQLSGREPVRKYTTANSGVSWTSTAISGKGTSLRKLLRPVCPHNAHADLPVLWCEGAYTYWFSPDYNTKLAAPFGPANATATLDLYFKASSLSPSGDTVFYIYFGNQAAAAQQDIAGTFPNDALVVAGDDGNWENLDLLMTGTVVDKQPSGGAVAVEELGAFGSWQRGGGSLSLSLGALINLAGATTLNVIATAEVQSGTPATSALFSNYGATTAGFMCRTNTTDLQHEVTMVVGTNTVVGGKFSDQVFAYDTPARIGFTFTNAGGRGIEGWKNGVKSATTYPTSSALDVTASAAFLLWGSPHSGAQKFKGRLGALRVNTGAVWSDDFLKTEYANLSGIGAFTALGTVESISSTNPIIGGGFGEMNERRCLFEWSRRVGGNPSGGENELQLLRQITLRYQSGALDADANRFITTASITDPTQQNAVYGLVQGMKQNGLWDLMTAIYPFVGGNATAHSYNLKNPSQFQGTFFGTVTHNSNGITGDGATGYMDTNLNPSVHLTADSASIGIYSKTDSDGFFADTFAVEANRDTGFDTKLGAAFEGNLPNGTGNVTRINASMVGIPSTGFFSISRTSSMLVSAYRNGAPIGTNTTLREQPLANTSLLIASFGGFAGFSARNYAFHYAGLGLTNAQSSALYTIVQQYQTALGRQV